MSVSVAKVRFKVVGCTSWEDGYHPKSMEEMHPFVTGWKSERYCPYPQQFVVCLRSKARIRKIQLLSHEYMIASKIELFVGRGLIQGQANSLLNIQYTRLGYVSLSVNDATNYKSREMKSINIDAEGQYLKLVLHTNHVNQLNLYNQVSVLALNILGHGLQSHITESQSTKVTGRQPPVRVSTINDLSFDMTLDPSSARLVKQLEEQKQQAIEMDQFELAKALKEAVSEIIKVGQILCHYEREKRHAIEREDFDEAKKWKSEKDSIEIQLKERLNFEQLLRGEIPIAREQGRKDKKVHYMPEELTNDTSTRQRNLPSLSSGQNLPPEPPLNQPMDIELPHINTSSQQQNSYSEYPDDDAEMPPSQPEPLTDAQLNEAAVAVQVFGDVTVAKVFSKLYHLREQGLTDVLDIMKKDTSFSRSEMTKALCQILRRGFSDKVLTSFNIAIDILKELMGEYAKRHRLSSSDLVTVLDKILPVVMNRFADTNTRIQSSSMRTILDLAAIPEVKPLLGHYLLRPLAQDKTKSLDDGSKLTISMETQARTVTWRYAKGRIEVLQAFLEVVNLETAHLTIPKIMEFVNISLQHNHAKVREAAAQLTVYLYKEYRDGAIRELLPVSSSDHIAMKNIFWRTLFQQLDEIDGVVRVSGQDSFEKAKKTKQNRLNSLKGELDALRSLAQATGQLPASEDSEEIATVTQTRVIDSATIEQTCPFCKSSRPEFNVKAHMDEHYAAECPMLLQCKKCTQVVEIKNYGTHMLHDCSSQTEMAECPKCHEVFGKTQLESHMKGSRCTAPPDDHVKCPLCHTNVQNNDESWHNHLMSVSSGCTKNPRRKRRRPGQQHIPVTKASEGATVIPR